MSQDLFALMPLARRASLALLLAGATGAPPLQARAGRRLPEGPLAEPPSLAFAEFFTTEGGELKPSPRLQALAGQRVKVVGFMARMEVAPKGAFYLTPRPVSCDEEGGGTADLPLEAVFVIVRSSFGKDIPHTARALEVTGRLEVGYRVEPDDRVTHIRLLLDRPQDLAGPPARSGH